MYHWLIELKQFNTLDLIKTIWISLLVWRKLCYEYRNKNMPKKFDVVWCQLLITASTTCKTLFCFTLIYLLSTVGRSQNRKRVVKLVFSYKTCFQLYMASYWYQNYTTHIGIFARNWHFLLYFTTFFNMGYKQPLLCFYVMK